MGFFRNYLPFRRRRQSCFLTVSKKLPVSHKTGSFFIGKENIPQRTASPAPRAQGGALSGQGSHVPYMVYTNGSEGFFITGAGVAAATRVPLRTEWVKNTLPPTTEPSPMSVSPPRIDAPE